MRLVRTRSLTVSVLVHGAIIAAIIFFPGFYPRKKPETRIYTVHVIKEASIKKRAPSRQKAPAKKKEAVEEKEPKPEPKPKPEEQPEPKPKPEEKPEPKPKEKTKPKKKLVTKNVLKGKEEVRKKIEEREKEIQKKFVEPEEFMNQEKATVETKDFEFPWYGDLVASKVYGSWVQPSKVTVGDAPLQAVIAFRVFKDGRATIMDVRSSSGKRLMDESASQAIEDAQPFPPFPADWKGDSIDVTVTFDLAE